MSKKTVAVPIIPPLFPDLIVFCKKKKVSAGPAWRRKINLETCLICEKQLQFGKEPFKI